MLISELARNSLTRYPDPSYSKLLNAITDFYGLSEQHVIPLNGAAEAYSLIPLALRPRALVSIDPTFGDLDDVALAIGAERVSVCMEPRDGEWVVDKQLLDEVLNKVRKPCLVIASIPNNPTGSIAARDVVDVALARGCVALLDYAFRDLSTVPVDPVLDEGVVALFSLTKVLSLPGIRIGFLATADETIARLLDLSRQPWNVNSLAAELVTRLLTDYGDYLLNFIELSKRATEFLRRYLVEKLRSLGVEIFRSVAPYVLARYEGMERVVECLWRRGIALRRCSSYRCLDSSFARISVRPVSDVDRLIEAMKVCLGEV